MIVTLTINPAIDRNVLADRLVFEDRAYILSRSESAGGRGINSSHVIHSFGGKTMAIATSGGKNGKRFEELLTDAGYPIELVKIKKEIRTNLTISDRQGLTVKLNETGPMIDAAEQNRIERAVASRIEGAKWLMLCGSLPPGVPGKFYARLIEKARAKGVKVMLDTDGEALLCGIEERPTLVTPNQQEAERLLNRALITKTHFQEAVERIHAMGAEWVILSLGSRGAIAMHDGMKLEATPPRVDAVCPIGAGDALGAAFVWAINEGKDFADALRWGVAAGSASACLPGVSFATLEQTRDIYNKVTVSGN